MKTDRDLIDIVPESVNDLELELDCKINVVEIDIKELENEIYKHTIENYTRSMRYYLSKKMMELSSGDKVLDIGSGDDGFAYSIQDKVESVYINDINVERIYNAKCVILQNNIFDLKINQYGINKVFLGHAFEHFYGDSDIKLIEKIGKELPIGGKCCIEPLFLGKKYVEVIRSGFQHREEGDGVVRILTEESLFPGKVEENMGFARIYSIDAFNRRIKKTTEEFGMTVEIYSFKSEGNYLPDMNKYKFKRESINYPYRAAIFEKIK